MILTCPECETQYFADDSTIGDSGRTVKCATCGHSWFVGPEGAKQGEASLGAHETYRLKVRERRRRKSRNAAFTAWTATAAALLVILAGLVLFRGEVVKRWPESATTYAAIGMPVNRFGLEFLETEAERFFDGTTPILEVRGAVRNSSGSTVSAPGVRVILLDDQGQQVAEAYAPVTPQSIPDDATAIFTARIENPPFESFELELDFVPADTALAATGSPSQ
ncbi:MAG: MJ0042-type zinc finger domain-containing protein, partial [Pseudomonadota bacterium]|nr:MJ0042-type zinc finger domain-containing protein [Pseudomonadota bacterium]